MMRAMLNDMGRRASSQGALWLPATISGERTQSSGDQYHSERSYGSFYRAIPLPENVDPDQIKATFTNGVLEVTMPAPRSDQPGRKKIEVK